MAVAARELNLELKLGVGIARLGIRHRLLNTQGAGLRHVLKDRLRIRGRIKRQRAVSVVLHLHGVGEHLIAVGHRLIGARDLVHRIGVGLAGIGLGVIDGIKLHDAIDRVLLGL